MKTFSTLAALIFASAVSANDIHDAIAHPADTLNSNLRHSANIAVQAEEDNLHQCYNHCERHHSKPPAWIANCKADCDSSYAPTPSPPQCYNLGDPCTHDSDCLTGGFNPCNKCGQTHGTEYFHRCYGEEPAPTPAPYSPPQCYNLGEPCTHDSDCLTGGFNPCTKCGQTHGTEYFHRCYGEETPEPTGEETPEPTPAPVPPAQCYNLGEPCTHDSDCLTGGFNPCNKCGTMHGTQYFHRCYSTNEDSTLANDEDTLIESDGDEDGPTWDDVKNGTRRAADKTADWGKKAADKTADWGKGAADKTKEWGKKTFDPNSGYAGTSSVLLAVVVSCVALQAFLLV